MQFRGHSENTSDAKGRTSLPAKFRDTLAQNGESRLVVTRGYAAELSGDDGHCLFLYPQGDFEALQEEISRQKKSLIQQGSADQGRQQMLHRIERTTIAHAEDLEIDKMGRILLPQKLRQWAGIDRDIVCVGQGKRMELWTPSRWARVEELANADESQADRERVEMELGF